MPSSLDPLEINRNRPRNRGRHCGRWTVAGIGPDGKVKFIRVDCRSWGCPYCGPRRAKLFKRSIRALAELHQLNRLLTLTLDPSKLDGQDPVEYINQVFAKFRVYLRRRIGEAPTYIRILEFQKNGNPHFHILIDRFIPQAWLSRAWEAVGGGRIVDIRYVSIRRVARYLAKYLTKDMLLSAPKGSRRVTTSRDIKLIEKPPKDRLWVFVRSTIFYLHSKLISLIASIEADEEGVLRMFVAEGQLCDMRAVIPGGML